MSYLALLLAGVLLLLAVALAVAVRPETGPAGS
jgi:hypothetical protein